MKFTEKEPENAADALVRKEVRERVQALSLEDTYFLHFVLRHLPGIRTFFRAMKEFGS
jgi:hypothetical protein